MEQDVTIQPAPIYDCIIIGGGISGIAFAHKLSRQGKKVVILEKEGRLGGQIQTYVSATHSTFWAELGAHTCYNSYVRLLSVVQEAGLQPDLLPLDKASYKLYVNDKIKSIASYISYFPMMVGCLKMPFASKEKKSVKEFFRPIVGAFNYDCLFSPLFRAVICQDADDYPASFFLKRRAERIKEVSHKYSFQRGLLALLNGIVEKDELSVRVGAEVVSIDRKGDIYSVKTAQAETLMAYNVTLATNPQVTACLLKGLEIQISDYLKTIPLFRSEAISVVVDKNAVNLPKIAGLISLSDAFLSVVSRDVSGHSHLRGFTFHFYDSRQSEKEKLHTICQVLRIKEEGILERSSTSHILPSPRVEHLDIISQINRLRTHPRLFIVGNYFYGLSLEDCVHRACDESDRFMTEI